MKIDISKFSKIKETKNLADLVYSEIRNQIIHLEIKPGEKLSEVEVACTLGISRTPVREAFKKLCFENLLESKPQRGTFVSFINLEEAKAAYFIRTSIECSVIELCIKTRCLDARIEELRSLISMQEKALLAGDMEHFLILDEQFHHVFYTSSNTLYVKELTSNIYFHSLRLRLMCMTNIKNITRVIDEHEQIVNSIEAREITLAKKALSTHINRNIESFLNEDSYASLRKYLI